MAPKKKKAKKPDRRVQRTRKYLQEALIELILEQGYDSISVQDIVDRADIGRSTFYTHYSTKDAVFIDSFKALESELKAAVDAADKAVEDNSTVQGDNYHLSFTKALFTHVDGHRTLYRAMARERGAILAANHIKKILYRLVRNDLNNRVESHGMSVITRDAAIHFVVGATFDLLSWWVDYKSEWSSDEVNAFLQSMVAPGIEAIFSDRRLLVSSC